MGKLTLILLALALMPALMPVSAAAQGRAAGVTTEMVETRTMSETVAVFGEVVSGRESNVAARVSGVLAEVPVRVGDRVAAGDVLAVLDRELLLIELDQAEADIAIAQAGLTVASANVARIETALRRAEALRANNTISDAQLEDRSGDFAVARAGAQEAGARLSAAQNALREAEYRVTNATVRAPFDGIVLVVATEEGQFVTVGSEVATLLDIGAMEIEANVPSRYVPALSQGLQMEARTDAGETLMLNLRAILPTEFSATRTRPVRMSVAEPGADIAVGQSVTLEIPVSAPRDVIVVPKDALVQGAGGWSVFVNTEGKATPRGVQIGAAVSGGFEVISGLVPGDEVVTRGNERLRPGQDIAPMNAAQPTASQG